MASQEFIDSVKNLLDIYYNHHEGCDCCKKLEGNSSKMVIDRVEILGNTLDDYLWINNDNKLELVVGNKKQAFDAKYCPKCGRRLRKCR